MSGVILSGTAIAGPVGGNVVAGSADIIAPGSAAVTVNQSSDRVVIDWANFDTQSHERIDFNQPGANSIALNRITNGSPTQFNGALNANGRVIIMNDNGVVFGQSAHIDVNGLIATTSNISNEDFMQSDSPKFNMPGNPDAAIINNGTISAKEAGLVGFVAPQVINNGLINVKLGKIHLASGDHFTFDLYGDGLVEIAATGNINKQLVENTGKLQADGGIIAMTASQARELVDNQIINSGHIEAKTISNKNGVIILSGEGKHAVAGNIETNKNNSGGSSKIIQSGQIIATGKNAGEKGGRVLVTADDVQLNGALIDVSGDTGGGHISLGGELQGMGTTSTAYTLNVDATSVLLANAITNGNGGKTILWSDDITKFSGTIEGKGGVQGGKGGFVETSGKNKLIAKGTVDLRASDGSAGNWLLDPTNIRIYNRAIAGTDNDSTFTTDYLESLSVGANITLTADNGITLDMTGDTLTLANDRSLSLIVTNGGIDTASSGSIVASGTGSILFQSGPNSLQNIDLTHTINLVANGSGDITFRAGGSINFANATSSITTNGGDIILNSSRNSGGGNISIQEASNFTSNGGDIIFGGGNDPTIGYAFQTNFNNGVYLTDSNLDARGTSAGGNIIVNGKSERSAGGGYGVQLRHTTIQTNNLGNITISGVNASTGSIAGSFGIATYLGTVISSDQGTITLNGTGGLGSGAYNIGIALSITNNGTPDQIISNSGDIILNGIGGSGSTGYGIDIYKPAAAAVVASNSGNITLTGTSVGGAAGIAYDSITNGNPETWGLIGNSSTKGTITFITDAFANLATTQTTGSVVIKPYSNNRIINVADGITGALDLSSALLNKITAGMITIGSATSGLMTVNAYNWNSDINLLSGDNITFSGAQNTNNNDMFVQTSGAGKKITLGTVAVGLGGNLTLTSDDITIDGALSGTGTLTLQQVEIDRTILINNGPDDGSRYFLDTAEIANLADGWGLINIGSLTGDAEHYFAASTWTDSVVFRSNYGRVLLIGDLNGTDNASFAFNLANSYLLIAVDADITTAGGSVSINTPNNWYTMVADPSSSSINTNGGAINIGNILIENKQDANFTLNSGNGDVTVSGTITDRVPNVFDKTLTLNAGTGTITFGDKVNTTANIVANGATVLLNGTWGDTTGLGNVNLTAVNNLTLPAITTQAGKTVTATVTGPGNKITTAAIATGAGGNITLTADDLVIGDALSGTGTLTLEQMSINRGMLINAGADDGSAFHLSATEIARLTDGWGLINVGSIFVNASHIMGASTWTDSVVFRSDYGRIQLEGDLVGTGDASFNFALPNSYLEFDSGASIITAGGDVTVDNHNIFGMMVRDPSSSSIVTNGGNVKLKNIWVFNNTDANLTVNSGNGNITVTGTITDRSASTLNRSLAFNSGSGAITFGGKVDTSANIVANGATITINDTWGDTTGLGNVTLTAINSLTLPKMTAASISVRATDVAANITVNDILMTTATGDALVLSANSFTNAYGAGALNTTNGGRFLVWSAATAGDTRNGQSYAFKQYNAVYGSTAVAGTGNGFLYTEAPVISVTLQGNVSKVYDGTNIATLVASNFNTAGALDGDVLTINGASGVYNDKNVASGKSVTVTGITLSAVNGSATVYGYQVNSTANNIIGTITPAALTITASDQTKIAGTTFNFVGSEFNYSGLVNGDVISHVDLNSTGSSASAAAGSYAIIASNAAVTGIANYNISYVSGVFNVDATLPTTSPPAGGSGSNPANIFTDQFNYKQLFSPMADISQEIVTSLQKDDQYEKLLSAQKISSINNEAIYDCLYTIVGFSGHVPGTDGQCR